MKSLGSIVVLFCLSSLSLAGSIEVNQSTTLANLISGVDTIDYPEMTFGDWGSYGGLGITPENLTITKREGLLLEFETPSPGFSLFGYSVNPTSGFEVASMDLLDEAAGIDGIASLGDTSTSIVGNTSIFADNNTDLLGGFNSITGGRIGHQWDLRPVVAVPEGGFVAGGALAGMIAMAFRKRRT